MVKGKQTADKYQQWLFLAPKFKFNSPKIELECKYTADIIGKR